MNHQESSYSSFDTHGLVKAGVVTALYVVMTLLVAPVAFGPVQFRISEALNFVGIYNRRYIGAITLGVIIVNGLQSTLVDVVVGGFHTFISLIIARWLGELLVRAIGDRFHNHKIIRYAVTILVFTFTMFIIAWMLIYMGYENYFWQTYGVLALSQFIVMTLGAFIMYPISDRVDFHQ